MTSLTYIVSNVYRGSKLIGCYARRVPISNNYRSNVNNASVETKRPAVREKLAHRGYVVDRVIEKRRRYADDCCRRTWFKKTRGGGDITTCRKRNSGAEFDASHFEIRSIAPFYPFEDNISQSRTSIRAIYHRRTSDLWCRIPDGR